MINIILCDDDNSFRKNIVIKIKKYMDKYNFEYKIHEFNDYNSQFSKIINLELTNKIYVLDIETPSRSGIDIARIIRKDDVESPIIFLTGHEELGHVILSKDIHFLAFINKFDNSSKRLNNALDLSMKLLNKKSIIRLILH